MSVANVSGFGAQINIVSTVTFPYGFSVDQFPDDVDPIQINELTVKKYEMLIDGRMIHYGTANPVEMAVSVIAGSDNDINLGIILSAARVRRQILPIPDMIIMVVTYPDDIITTLTNGTIISGPPLRGIGVNGKIRTNTYRFAFGTSITVGAGGLSSAASIGAGLGEIV